MAAISGRPDRRLSKFIYADGQGGVTRDMRYSAQGVDNTDFAEADLRVKNGTYRGFEKRRFTRVFAGTGSASTGIQEYLTLPFGTFNNLGNGGASKTNCECYVLDVGTGNIFNINSINNSAACYVYLTSEYPAIGNITGNWLLVAYNELPTSTGGSFLQTDVIGDPANILLTDALKDGWEGSWIPQMPDGVTSSPLTRKSLFAAGAQTYTQNNGGSWESANLPITNTTNAVGSVPTGYIVIAQYQAFAKQTEPAVNSVVYGVAGGVGKVANSARHETALGSLLSESLLGTIPKGLFKTGVRSIADSELVSALVEKNTGKLSNSNGYFPEHTQLVIETSNNAETGGFKALDYNVSLNQQAFKQYAATELIWGGSDWGDDSKVTIVNNESTKTDLNGNTVKVVTHRLRESLGWIKNKL